MDGQQAGIPCLVRVNLIEVGQDRSSRVEETGDMQLLVSKREVPKDSLTRNGGTMSKLNMSAVYARISSSAISLVSGILLSAGINILTGVMMNETVTCRSWMFVTTGILLLVASAALYISATTLDETKRLWALAQFDEATWTAVVSPHLRKLNVTFCLACGGSVSAIVFIALGIAHR